MGLGTNIVNLSSKDLTDSEKALLARGLKFIPTPDSVSKSDILDTHTDFARKIKLSYFFHGMPDRGHNGLFKQKSSWEPPEGLLPPEIVGELDELKVKLGRINVLSETSNIAAVERCALDDLQNYHDVVIKKADKGNAIVIMDREQYIREALNQLGNTKYYTKIDEPVYPQTFTRVQEILDRLRTRGYLDYSQVKYLSPDEDARPRVFYMLPKIHKPMDKWTVPNKCPPGRPIVSDCGSDSYRWSELIDHCLKPLACSHPSYVKDTSDFLDKLRELKISDNALLVTCDVESLYTNIQPHKGLEALDKVYRNSTIGLPMYDEVRELLEISLKHNDFQFDGQWYLQISGTAMGKKYAPNYANIFMANFEQEVLSKAELKPTVYLRYLDDIFMIWEHSRQELDSFLELFNSQDSSIKLKAEISNESVDFLDVTVFKGNQFKHHNILDTKVYFKPTDTHQLLDRHSFHPSHTFDGIIKSQLLRFYRICTNIDDFHDATSKLFKALREQRHYSARHLRKIKSVFLRSYIPIGDHHEPLGASMKCNRKRCECCLRIKETSYFSDRPHLYDDFPIQGRLDCQSKNIIYIIECLKCHDLYIGETERTLAARLQGHISDINTFKDKPVAEHFNNQCWPDTENMVIYPIQCLDRGPQSKQKCKADRLRFESHWIRELCTQIPDGMNKKLPVKRDIMISLPFNKTSREALKLFRQTLDNISKKFPVKFRDQLVCAFRRNKNLGDYLVSSKLK